MSRRYRRRKTFIRVLLGWMARVAVVVVIAVIGMAGYQFVKSGGLSVVRSLAAGDDVPDIAGLIESGDVTDVIENWSGAISALTGVEYDVVETESGTYVQITAEELSDLASAAQSYLSAEDQQAIASQYGISIDAIADGDYSSIGLSGAETLQISTEELESYAALVQQYLGN